MLNEIYNFLTNTVWNIYVTPLWFIVLAMVFLVVIWAVLSKTATKKYPRFWTWLNRFLLVLSVGSILFVTIITRTKGTHTPDLIPFNFIQRAEGNREVYRSVLMNVFLFVPFGLFAPFAFSRKKFIRTVAWALIFSAAIEIAQLIFSLGMLTTDDVIANVLGAFIGSFAYIIIPHNQKTKKRKTKK